MFEAYELRPKLGKRETRARVPGLREELLRLQFELRERDFPVILLVEGDDRIGCVDVLQSLHEWLDVRLLEGHAYGSPSDEETARPFFWRYWRAVPPAGRIGVFHRSWAIETLREYLLDEIGESAFERRLRHIRALEEALTDDGALLVKFWLHAPPDVLEKRLRAAKKGKKHGWRVTERDELVYENYDRALAAAERLIRRTDTGHAPWRIVEGTDERYRNVAVAEKLVTALRGALERAAPPSPSSATLPAIEGGRTVLESIDLSKRLERDEYEKDLDRLQARLAKLSNKAQRKGVASVLVFEGWDAGGKGGAIRRVGAALDPTAFHVCQISAPTEEERARHYLWRFWRHVPRDGHVTVFDRSWYGRVLVERVEGFASDAEWRRAYAEINDFEEQLSAHGIAISKFWLHIDPDEQLRRFQEREKTPFKMYKLTDED